MTQSQYKWLVHTAATKVYKYSSIDCQPAMVLDGGDYPHATNSNGCNNLPNVSTSKLQRKDMKNKREWLHCSYIVVLV